MLSVVESKIVFILRFGNNRLNKFRRKRKKKKDWDETAQVIITIIMIIK